MKTKRGLGHPQFVLSTLEPAIFNNSTEDRDASDIGRGETHGERSFPELAYIENINIPQAIQGKMPPSGQVVGLDFPLRLMHPPEQALRLDNRLVNPRLCVLSTLLPLMLRAAVNYIDFFYVSREGLSLFGGILPFREPSVTQLRCISEMANCGVSHPKNHFVEQQKKLARNALDKLGAMAIFLRIAEAGSLSGGAKRLGLPLATVSRRIAELEAHLKARMINRSSRHFSLTDAGRLYLDAAKHILDQVDVAECAARGAGEPLQGRLIVTSPILFGRMYLVPVVADFLAEYPSIDLKLLLADKFPDLQEWKVDVAISIGKQSEAGFVGVPMGRVRCVTCASPHYLSSRGRPERPENIQQHVCITFDTLDSPEGWRFASPAGTVLVPIHSRLTVTTAEAAVAAAAAGTGLTRLLCYQIAEGRRLGQLDLVLEGFEPPPLPVNLSYASHAEFPEMARAFFDFALPRLSYKLREDSLQCSSNAYGPATAA